MSIIGSVADHQKRLPDGGWGWVVVMSCCFTNMIIDGVKYSFGVFMVDLSSSLDTSQGETAFVMSLQVAVMLFIGPIAGGLTNRFGCRKLAVTGALIAFIGYLSSYFATGVYFLYGSFGIISGLGFGLLLLPQQVCLLRHFNERLAIATGIATMGSGLGSIVFNPLTRVLLDTYSWQGTLLIDAGLVLNTLAFAAVLRPITDKPPREKQASLLDVEGFAFEEITGEKSMITEVALPSPDELANAYEDAESRDCVADTACPQLQDYERQLLTDEYDVQTTVITLLKSNEQFLPVLKSNEQVPVDIEKPQPVTKYNPCLNLGTLKDARFLIFVCSQACVELGHGTPFGFLPGLMASNGYPKEEAVWLLLVIGVCNTLSRLLAGWIGDRPCVNRLYFCASVLFIEGAAIAIFPFGDSYPSIMAISIVFGVSSGAANSVRPVLVPDLFGKHILADVLGLLQFFSGIATFIGLPLAGFLHDNTRSYLLSFLVSGLQVAAAAVFLLVVPKVRKCVSITDL